MTKTILISLLIINSFCFSQTNVLNNGIKIDELPDKYTINQDFTVIDSNEIYADIGFEKPAHFCDDFSDFVIFLSENFIVPKEVLEKKINGRFFFDMIIEKDGSLSDIKIIRDLGYGSGKEMLRVLKLSPKWIPAKHKGILIRVRKSIAIKLSDI